MIARWVHVGAAEHRVAAANGINVRLTDAVSPPGRLLGGRLRALSVVRERLEHVAASPFERAHQPGEHESALLGAETKPAREVDPPAPNMFQPSRDATVRRERTRDCVNTIPPYVAL